MNNLLIFSIFNGLRNNIPHYTPDPFWISKTHGSKTNFYHREKFKGWSIVDESASGKIIIRYYSESGTYLGFVKEKGDKLFFTASNGGYLGMVTMEGDVYDRNGQYHRIPFPRVDRKIIIRAEDMHDSEEPITITAWLQG